MTRRFIHSRDLFAVKALVDIAVTFDGGFRVTLTFNIDFFVILRGIRATFPPSSEYARIVVRLVSNVSLGAFPLVLFLRRYTLLVVSFAIGQGAAGGDLDRFTTVLEYLVFVSLDRPFDFRAVLSGWAAPGFSLDNEQTFYYAAVASVASVDTAKIFLRETLEFPPLIIESTRRGREGGGRRGIKNNNNDENKRKKEKKRKRKRKKKRTDGVRYVDGKRKPWTNPSRDNPFSSSYRWKRKCIVELLSLRTLVPKISRIRPILV